MGKIGKIALVLVLCFSMICPNKVSAAGASDAFDYVWGETYSSRLNYSSERYYKFDLSEKSNLYIELVTDVDYYNGCWVTVYDPDGNVIISSDDFTANKNSVTGLTTQKTTRIVPEGSYYIKIRSQGALAVNYSLFATQEPAIELSRPKIKTVKNSKSQKLSVTVDEVNDSTGYEYQYSLNENFGNPTTLTGDKSIKLNNLTKGKSYYIRVRAYAIYGAGNKVYSAWSIVKIAKVKK
ncbi:MAG: hypothetical protein K6G45_13735 [Lachnospiraceae bacterium]|nr:hypothetical protein [Lachnospiraceae bacterium]